MLKKALFKKKLKKTWWQFFVELFQPHGPSQCQASLYTLSPMLASYQPVEHTEKYMFLFSSE